MANHPQGEPKKSQKSPFGTEDFERQKPSVLRIIIMTLAIITILIAVGYFFGN